MNTSIIVYWSEVVLSIWTRAGTAAAVAVSGLIGFVGIIVPHAVRLAIGASYRVVLPLSLLVGGGFLVLADVIARTLDLQDNGFLDNTPVYDVPPGHFFMMGDNRDDSFDSRYWGPVERRRIVGQATAVVLSFDRAHYWLPRWQLRRHRLPRSSPHRRRRESGFQ